MKSTANGEDKPRTAQEKPRGGDQLDLDPEPTPVRSDQLPEDAPSEQVPDDLGHGRRRSDAERSREVKP